MIKMENEIKEQIKKMNELIEQYEKLMKDKVKLDEQLLEVEEKLKKKEIIVKEEVFAEVDEITGKKAYTNEEMRKNATITKLEEDQEYALLKNKCNGLTQTDNNIKAEIDILNKRISLIKKQAELMIALVELKKIR
jgi:hypothetical protein